ncbi:MAG: hypothetical protein SGI92_15475 [Bryobacteraceae bacterium]|nr:hypothetical protein [Bryobacteraceae bacterium]
MHFTLLTLLLCFAADGHGVTFDMVEGNSDAAAFKGAVEGPRLVGTSSTRDGLTCTWFAYRESGWPAPAANARVYADRVPPILHWRHSAGASHLGR